MSGMQDCWDLMRKIESAQNDASYHAKELDKENALLGNLTSMLAAALRKLPHGAVIVYGDKAARIEGTRVVMFPAFGASSVKLELESEDCGGDIAGFATADKAELVGVHTAADC